MRASAKNRILKRIRGKGRGSVFVTRDFLDLGSRDVVDKALSRLAGDGSIRRLRRGLFDYPKVHKQIGPLSPNLDLVAQALARKSCNKLQVSGARAANALGLSQQVPAKTVYLTDGPTRDVRLDMGNQVLRFRHRASRALAGAGSPSGLVLQALRYLGPAAVTPDVLTKLDRVLSPQDKVQLRELLPDAPVWMHDPIGRLIQRPAADAA